MLLTTKAKDFTVNPVWVDKMKQEYGNDWLENYFRPREVPGLQRDVRCMPFSNPAEHAILDFLVLGQALGWEGGPWYLSLFSATPLRDGSNIPSIETTIGHNGYARVSMVAATVWESAASAGSPPGQIANKIAVAFAPSDSGESGTGWDTTGSATQTHFGIHESATLTTDVALIGFGPLGSNRTVDGPNITITFQAGNLKLSFAQT